MKKSVFVALVALTLVAAEATLTPAQAAFDLGIVGNFSLLNVSSTPAPATPNSSKMGIGFGAIASFDLIPAFNLDAGLIYAGRKINNGTADISFNYLEIPVVARYTILPMISVGGGLYYGMAMGDVSSSAGSATYASQGMSTSDMGLILSAGIKVPAPGMHIIANINYLMGMKDLNSPSVAGSSSKWGGLELQGGVSFGL